MTQFNILPLSHKFKISNFDYIADAKHPHHKVYGRGVRFDIKPMVVFEDKDTLHLYEVTFTEIKLFVSVNGNARDLIFTPPSVCCVWDVTEDKEVDLSDFCSNPLNALTVQCALWDFNKEDEMYGMMDMYREMRNVLWAEIESIVQTRHLGTYYSDFSDEDRHAYMKLIKLLSKVHSHL